MPCNRSDERGLSIVEVFIALLVLGAFSAGFMKMLSDNFHSMARLQNNSDLEAIKFTVLAKGSCTRTLAAAGGACNGLVSFRDKNDAVWLSGSQPTYLGKWALRATCSGTDLSIEAAQLNQGQPITASADAAFGLDPMTKGHLKWKPLFAQGITPCSDVLPTTAPIATIAPTASPVPPPTINEQIRQRCRLRYPSTVVKGQCGINADIRCPQGETLILGGATLGSSMGLQNNTPISDTDGRMVGWHVSWFAASNCAGFNALGPNGSTAPGSNPCFGTFCGGVYGLCCTDN